MDPSQPLTLGPILQIKIIYTIIQLLLLSSSSWARWKSPREANYSIEVSKVQIFVKKDGTFKQTVERLEKVSNDAGRAIGSLTLNYNPNNENIKLLSARIKNSEQWIPVSEKNISDQSIRQSEIGFDDTRQIFVSFPSIKVGSELSYKYQTEMVLPTIKNHYWNTFTFGGGALWKKVEIQILSEIPIYLEVNDPRKHMEIIKEESLKNYMYTIRLKTPIIEELVDEVLVHHEDTLYTYVNVSTTQDYSSLFGSVANNFNKELQAPLPKSFEKIIEDTETIKNKMDRIAKILDLISEQLRYMGDWRRVNGGLAPRTLAEIASTHSGDCKDLSLLLTKILRNIGIASHIALVYRGDNPPQMSRVPTFPFNHAIVMAEVDNKNLWLDPTNFASYPAGIPLDISDRPALILTAESPQKIEIPFTPSEENIESVEYTYKFQSNGPLKAKVQLIKTGQFALENSGALLSLSKTQFEEATMANFVVLSNLINFRMELPDLKTRIVRPLKYGIEWTEKHVPALSTHGLASRYSPSYRIFDLMDLKFEGRVSGFKIGTPNTISTKVNLKNVKISGRKLKDCSVKSPWFDYDFKIDYSQNSYRSMETTKKSSISREELKSPSFSEFHNQLKNCARVRYIIYE